VDEGVAPRFRCRRWPHRAPDLPRRRHLRTLLGSVARETGVDYNILSGRIDRIKDTPYGQLVVALVGGDQSAAQAAFVAAGVHVEELRR
jgi:ABC-type methionine transport system ATPase subunit